MSITPSASSQRRALVRGGWQHPGSSFELQEVIKEDYHHEQDGLGRVSHCMSVRRGREIGRAPPTVHIQV